jgi:hypothetical protein
MGRKPKCYGTHDGVIYWINADFCGVFCGCMTYVLLCYALYVVTFHLIQPWLGLLSFLGVANLLVFASLVMLACWSHYKCMTTDPGAVPLNARPLPSDLQEQDAEAQLVAGITQNPYRKFCKRCKAFKPVRAHHCSMCRRCIIKMDHHCPWVNNCVGIGNHKLFLLFLLWVNMCSIFALVLILSRYYMCLHDPSG